MTASLLHCQLKRSHSLSLLIRLCVYQTPSSSFVILIAFVNIPFKLKLGVVFTTLYFFVTYG
jgi:hypothetical protein